MAVMVDVPTAFEVVVQPGVTVTVSASEGAAELAVVEVTVVELAAAVTVVVETVWAVTAETARAMIKAQVFILIMAGEAGTVGND